MNPNIIKFIVLTISTLLGVLGGIYVAVAVSTDKNKLEQKKTARQLKREKERQQKEEAAFKEDREDDLSPSVESATSGKIESQYTEGQILKQKLKRNSVSLFDLGCAAEDVDPMDKVRRKQSTEDDSYEILKHDQ